MSVWSINITILFHLCTYNINTCIYLTDSINEESQNSAGHMEWPNDKKMPSYLVDIRKAAAPRITSDTTSWVAGGDVRHLWVETVSEVQLCEICRLGKEQEHQVTTGIKNSKKTFKNRIVSISHHLAKSTIKFLHFLSSQLLNTVQFYQKSQN